MPYSSLSKYVPWKSPPSLPHRCCPQSPAPAPAMRRVGPSHTRRFLLPCRSLSLFPHPALERRARVVPTKDVPHRRSRRHRDRRPHLGCTRTQVRPTDSFPPIVPRCPDANCSLLSLPVSLHVCSNFMRQQAMASKMVFNRPVPVNRLVSAIANSSSFLSLFVSHGMLTRKKLKKTNKRHFPRGPGEHAGIRTTPIRRRIPRHRPGPHRPTPIRVLPERHLLRVLCRLDRRTQPKRQDVPREAL